MTKGAITVRIRAEYTARMDFQCRARVSYQSYLFLKEKEETDSNTHEYPATAE
jgi:hypothetical protein